MSPALSENDKYIDPIYLLYQNPSIPVFLIKSNDGKRFNIDENSKYIPDHLKKMYKAHKEELLKNRNFIILSDLKSDISLKFADKIQIDGDFTTYSILHQKIAAELTKIFMDTNIEDLPSTIAYIKDRINPRLFYYSFSVALNHTTNADLRKIRGDHLAAFPLDFFGVKYLREAFIGYSDDQTTKPLANRDITGTLSDREYRLAYFREDIALNIYNNNWSIIYPSRGDKSMVDKDRRGELFYYKNHQMAARYNAERLCGMLPLVRPFFDFKREIDEGYFSKLRKSNTENDWPGRPCGLSWKSIHRSEDDFSINVTDMIGWRSRIEQAIDEGKIINDNKSQSITSKDQVDESKIEKIFSASHQKLDLNILANMIEASILSPNRDLYGMLHNYGHILTAYIHDPTNMFTELMSVMGDSVTAPRDPMFYRWIALINEVFQKFKKSHLCPQYTEKELNYEDIIIEDIGVEMNGKESLETFWRETELKVHGFDLEKKGLVKIKYKHLDHTPFTYKIRAKNNTEKPLKATVRIFIAPKCNANDDQWYLDQQRRLFIEMDRFVYTFKSGSHEISRNSTDSSVTIPLKQSFPVSSDTKISNDDIYSKGGWPHHLLVPKGNTQGAKFQLFVMITNDAQDDVGKVKRSTVIEKEPSSYCGLKNSEYPDKRAMGFPFDRPLKYEVIEDFVNKYKNTRVFDLIIEHKDETVVDSSK